MYFLSVDHDHLLAEDLDKTLEAPGEKMSPKANADPESCEKAVQVCNILISLCSITCMT